MLAHLLSKTPSYKVFLFSIVIKHQFGIMNQINDITYKIRGCIFETYNTLGPCLLESAYEAYLFNALLKCGLKVERQVSVDISIENIRLTNSYKIDLLVEDTVIIEIKSVESIDLKHKSQIITYLKLSNKPVGFLVNFCCSDLKNNIIRIVNNLDENK